ncbi:DUF4365 domain-containing protein [Vibrio parahaemolyticus]|nr:DUF4365 domain-containing protein [Vibrio parahaemolyticus]
MGVNLKYTEDKATGDAGEYLFAYTVSSVLEWPCRLLDIDIGIDAQVEVLDDNRQSMGQFFAVQVKATKNVDKSKISVEDKHIEYWDSLETPVIIAFVNLAKKKVYVRSFDDFKESKTLHFRDEHELTHACIKEKLRMLVYSKVTNKIQVKLECIDDDIDNLLSDLTSERVHEIEDCDYYIGLINDFKKIELELHKVKVSLSPIHSIVGDCNYNIVLNNYMYARESYIRFLYAWDFHIHDHSAVNTFENEYVGQYAYLEL